MPSIRIVSDSDVVIEPPLGSGSLKLTFHDDDPLSFSDAAIMQNGATRPLMLAIAAGLSTVL